MPDNSTNDITEVLVKLMDGELSATEQQAVEKMLENDANLNERYQYLLSAKQAIMFKGLSDQVRTIQNEYLNAIQPSHAKPARIIKSTSFASVFMRVAAVFFMAIAGYGVFQYTTTDSQNVFTDNYTNYQLPVTRGNEIADTIDGLYSSGNYQKVVSAVNIKNVKTQKDYFIAGQSYLQLNNAGAAINAFNKVEEINQAANEKYFVEETDYYLALAYIKTGDIKKAEQLLNKITNNKQHAYYSKAKNITGTKLFILNLKEKQ